MERKEALGLDLSAELSHPRSSFERPATRRRGTLQLSPRQPSKRPSSPSLGPRTAVVHLGSGTVEVGTDKVRLVEEAELGGLLDLLAHTAEPVRQNALTVIKGLEKNASGQVLIMTPAAFAAFQHLLQFKSEAAQRRAVYSLAKLAAMKDNTAKIMSEIGYSRMAELAAKDDLDIQCGVVGLLGNLASHGGIRKEIAKAGGVQLLTDLGSSSSDMKLNRKVAFALANMLIDSYHGKKMKVQGIEMLIKWMDSEDTKLLSGAAICLANLSNIDDMDTREKMASLGVVEVLAEQLLKIPSQPSYLEAQKGVTMAIANLTTKKKSRLLFLKTRGVVKALISLGGSSSDAEVKLAVVMTINNLVTTATDELTQCGAPALLALFAESGDPDITREATEALAVLVPNEVKNPNALRQMSFVREPSTFSRSKMVRVVPSDEIQTFLLQLSSVEDVNGKKDAIKDLREISSRVENGKRIVQLGGIKPIVQMVNCFDDINVTIDALKTIKNILLEGARAAAQNALREVGIIPVLINLLGKDIIDAINKLSLDIITDLCFNNIANQTQLRSAIPVVIDHLKHSKNQKVKLRAARALGALCAKNRQMQQIIRKSGGILEVMNCLNQHDDAFLQKNAAGSLMSMLEEDSMNQEKFKKLGGFSSIINAIDKSSDDELKSVCCVLGRVCVRGPNEKNQSAFRKLNIFPTVVSLMFSKNESLVSYVTTFVLELIREHQKNQETLVYSGGIPPIVTLLQSSNPVAVFNALGITWMLTRKSEKRRAAFRNARAVDAITPLLKAENNNVKEGARRTLAVLDPKGV